MSDCPIELQPINGRCPDKYPLLFTTFTGYPCCYKKKNFFKRMPLMPLEIHDEGEYAPCQVLLDYERAFEEIYKIKNITPRSPDVFGFLQEETFKDLRPNFSKKISLRYLPLNYCDVIVDQLPTLDWVTKQRDYINNLSNEDHAFLRAYTWYGDKLINKFLRKGILDVKYLHYVAKAYASVGPPLFHPSNGDLDNIVLFKHKLDELIKNAPPLDKDILVFRRISGDSYNTLKKDNILITQGIISTSLDSGLDFGGDTVCRIRLLKGTKCALIINASNAPTEMEILLPHKSVFYIQDTITNKRGEPVIRMVAI